MSYPQYTPIVPQSLFHNKLPKFVCPNCMREQGNVFFYLPTIEDESFEMILCLRTFLVGYKFPYITRTL